MKKHVPVPPDVDAVAREIVDAAFCVHKELGPGLLESVYETCLCHELSLRKVPFRSQVEAPILYRGMKLEARSRLDLLVADKVIVEVKSVAAVHEVCEAQILTYLKLMQVRLGLLINFNVPVIKLGIERLVL